MATTNNPAAMLKNLEDAKVSIMFQVPIALKVQLDNEAKQKDIGTAALVRQIVGDYYGMEMELIKPGRRASGLSADEKKAAARAREKTKRDLIKQVLAKYQSGGEDAAKAFVAELMANAEEDNDGDDSDNSDDNT